MKSSSSPSSPSPSPSPPPPKDDVKIKMTGHDSPTSNTTTVKNDDRKVFRGSSYDFSNNDAVMRAAANSEDFDFITESHMSKIPESPTNHNNHHEQKAKSELLVRRKSTLARTKTTKSRLLDPPEEKKSKNQTPKTTKSHALGIRSNEMEEEEDPFLLEGDVPDHYRRMRYSPLSIMQLVSLILITGLLICTLTINYLKKITVLELHLWRWELMVLVLISGRLLSGWGVRIVVFLMERNFLWRKRVLYFVYGLRNAVQNCVWLALVLVSWQLIFDKKVERLTNGRILPYVTKVWVCLLVGTIIWLFKTVLVKVLASSFHVSTFFDRIQESLFNQYVIETLSGPPWVEIEIGKEEEERVMVEVQKLQNAGATIPPDIKANLLPKSGRLIGTPGTNTAKSGAKNSTFSKVLSKKEEQRGITIDELHRLNQKNVSAWNMKRLVSIVRKGAISTLHEKIRGSTGNDESVEQITSENEAKAAAKKIFVNVAKPGSRYIYEEDLLRFMREDEVSKTMGLFEGATEHKGISKRTLKNWVVNAFRERRALALSLNDTNTAVKKLHEMINVLVGLILVVIWLLILKIATTRFFIFLSSQLLLAAFMFGNTLKTTFEGIIFLFVMHPFDVGDRIEVDGVHMVVEEMNILTTVFLKFDNHKIYYPNSVLAVKPIYNYYRSPDMRETIDFSIHISTPPEKIVVMKEKIRSYFNNKSEHWHPEPKIVMKDMEDMNRLQWSMWGFQTMNFHDMNERYLRRSRLVEELVKIFRELNIEYRLLPLDVNVRNMPALTSARLPTNWSVCGA